MTEIEKVDIEPKDDELKNIEEGKDETAEIGEAVEVKEAEAVSRVDDELNADPVGFGDGPMA